MKTKAFDLQSMKDVMAAIDKLKEQGKLFRPEEEGVRNQNPLRLTSVGERLCARLLNLMQPGDERYPATELNYSALREEAEELVALFL